MTRLALGVPLGGAPGVRVKVRARVRVRVRVRVGVGVRVRADPKPDPNPNRGTLARALEAAAVRLARGKG